ncbi:hypothetical protein Zm00014a_038568 [Zea mays]|uniref:Uncharacterized protein n=1 Tax=Zea mays TaxID=4577 RepID=A0A3L6EDX0_MAIZE|nr:hypothetical protein Zm00014a_038568 [Zea mays]
MHIATLPPVTTHIYLYQSINKYYCHKA